MTNLQTISPKTPAEMGNFFQMPLRGSSGNLSNADFDSFLGSRDSKDQAEELLEEQEASKKRRKAADAGLATASTQQEEPVKDLEGAPLKTKENGGWDSKSLPDLEGKLSTKNDSIELEDESQISAQIPSAKDSSAAAPIPSADQTSIENPTDELEEEVKNSLGEPEIDSLPQGENLANKEEDLQKETKSQSESRGMESAPSDAEMIATTTSEGLESPIQPLREPAITTIHRLSAFSSQERSAIAPVAGLENSTNSGLGHAGTGLPMPPMADKSPSLSPSAQAAGLFKSLAPELDKFRQTDRSQIQLDLPVGDNESVRIKLSLRGGELRSIFITESPELREALQKAWPEFSQNSRDRGFRLGDPSFQQSYSENNTDLGQNNRRQTDTGTRESGEMLSSTPMRKPLSNRSSASQPASTALWA